MGMNNRWDVAETRIVVQLQERTNHLFSVTNARYGLTFLEVAMAVMTLYSNSAEFFPSRTDRQRYETAAKRLCETLYRANRGKHDGTDGNRFREQFRARYQGKDRQFRIDIEVVGPLAVSV